MNESAKVEIVKNIMKVFGDIIGGILWHHLYDKHSLIRYNILSRVLCFVQYEMKWIIFNRYECNPRIAN